MKKRFDPKQYKGKRTVYGTRPKDRGISDIFDWHDGSASYVKREMGLRYYAIKKSKEGRQLSKCFETLDEARRWRMQDDNAPRKLDAPRLGDVIERFFESQAAHLRASTILTYRNQSNRLSSLTALPMNRLDEFAVDQWLRDLKQSIDTMKSSRLSFEKEVGLLGQICRYYVEYFDSGYHTPILKRHLRDAVISATRIAERRSVARRRFLTESQRRDFLTAMRANSTGSSLDLQIYVLSVLQILTGLRIGEACALRWNDIDFARNTLVVSRTVIWSRKAGVQTEISDVTKTGEVRDIPLLSEVRAVLLDLREQSGRQLGLVFSKNGTEPLSYRAVQYRYNRAFAKAGIGFSSTHILRHSFATDFLTKTSDPSALQGILGHTTSKQTSHYAKITSDLKQRAMNAYSQRLSSDIELTKVIELGKAGNDNDRAPIDSTTA